MEEKQIKAALEKIQKLQALQQGAEAIGSLEEAANAAEKIQRLLLKYNLDLEDAKAFGKAPEVTQMFKDVTKLFGFNPREGLWLPQLAHEAAIFFLCRVLNTKEGDYLYMTYIGKVHNIEVAFNATLNLISSIRFSGRQAWKKHQDGSQLKGAFLRSYYAGAVMGLRYSIARIRKERETEAAKDHGNVVVNGGFLPMVILNQIEKRALDEVNKYMEEKVEFKSKVVKSKPVTNATMLGFEKGKTLTPQASLGGSEISGKLK